jgi:PH domain
MSVHGAFLQSPSRAVLCVSCLDNWTRFTLLDSAGADESGNHYKYLRSESGQYLAADEGGRLWLDDINAAPQAISEEKQQEVVQPQDVPSQSGQLRPCHRWSIKKGACQSLQSFYEMYLTISEDGEISLTPTRYEESCLHICFAVIQGWLRKKTEGGLSGFRRWKAKWFVLSGSTLTFFDRQADIYNRDNNAALTKKNSGVSHSNSCAYSTAGILSINVYPSPSCRFDVEFVNGRVLQVKADSDTSRERWVRALRNGKVGKQMDAKAKAGKKKKERENTVKIRQQQRQREQMEEGNDHEHSFQSSAISISASDTSFRSTAQLGLSNTKTGLRVQTGSQLSIQEEPPMRITVTHDRGMTAADDCSRSQQPTATTPTQQSQNQQASSASSADAAPTGRQANTRSMSATPDLSLYIEQPQSPTDFSVADLSSGQGFSIAAISGVDLSRAVSDGSNTSPSASQNSGRVNSTIPSPGLFSHKRSSSVN